jgi:hypothetical protein
MSNLHDTTFAFLNPSDAQKAQMQICREAVKACADVLGSHVPDGPDKTYLLRKLREVGMWANVAITRQPDGSPRA